MPRRRALLVAATLAATLVACSRDGREMREPKPDQTQSVEETTTTSSTTPLAGFDTSPAPTAPAATGVLALAGPWPDGGPIDPRFTCDGANVSPSLRWFGTPAGTSTLAVVVEDPDADGFVHWIIANIPGDVSVIPEGTLPPGAIQGTNDGGAIGWTGPCPPEGESHQYLFTLYALDQQLDLPDGTPSEDLLAAIGASALGTATYTGVYPAA